VDDWRGILPRFKASVREFPLTGDGESTMRQLWTVFIFVSALWGGMEPAAADCLVRSKLDEMHQLQMRMVHNSNAVFFGDEIRRLRVLSDGLGTPEVLRAVNGSRWVGHGAAFRQFLDNTNRLLVRASLDDPQSVRPHFDTKTQQNLQAIGGHMNSLRCTANQQRPHCRLALPVGSTGQLPGSHSPQFDHCRNPAGRRCHSAYRFRRASSAQARQGEAAQTHLRRGQLAE
jgi:hypothetical protein